MREEMDDSGAILCQISHLKDMLDQVNEEIEANYQITREIESEFVGCSEIESALAVRESELTKTVYMLNFEISGLMAVTANSRTAWKHIKEELSSQKMKRDVILERMNNKRILNSSSISECFQLTCSEVFCTSCLDFQKDMDKENGELETLILEKEYLENEIHLLGKKISSMQNSLSAFTEVLEDLNNSNSALLLEIESGNFENERLFKDIKELKATLLATMTI